jgi:uracil-DNA glycosylase family 4
MNTQADVQQRVALQHLQTEQLLGVDFVPLFSGGPREIPDPVGVQPPAGEGPEARLAALRLQVEADFPFCSSLSSASRPVFGEGPANARLMFVGEAPGAQEDQTGRPFVGAAGQKLEQIIAAMGLERDDVYIANILKARPPDNRTPTIDEIEASAPYLCKQLDIIQPEVIIALGAPATKFILQTNEGISRLRGRWGAWEHEDLRIPVMPTFHPAYLLRNYTQETREQVWSDIQKVVELLGLPSA